MWIDTHCHLDAREFAGEQDEVVARARAAGVSQVVLQAVEVGNFETVRALAHRYGLAYALGIHPMCTGEARDEDLDALDDALARHRDDPRLVAVGEIGLDGSLPSLDRARQEAFYIGQLKLARRHGLPVILHVRKSADGLLAGLRRIEVSGGLAHAFNASDQQAGLFVARGFRLGFGGNVTFDRARQIRHLATTLPAHAIVMETDAPDIPPRWLYLTAAEREVVPLASPAGPASGEDAIGAAPSAPVARLPQARNEPAEVARIGEALAALRGVPADEWARITTANAHAALPRLAALG